MRWRGIERGKRKTEGWGGGGVGSTAVRMYYGWFSHWGWLVGYVRVERCSAPLKGDKLM